tara:strand:+ start:148 stop:330 length:183 start_codon:yes stop_codon:yes gene_type:complete
MGDGLKFELQQKTTVEIKSLVANDQNNFIGGNSLSNAFKNDLESFLYLKKTIFRAVQDLI